MTAPPTIVTSRRADLLADAERVKAALGAACHCATSDCGDCGGCGRHEDGDRVTTCAACEGHGWLVECGECAVGIHAPPTCSAFAWTAARRRKVVASGQCCAARAAVATRLAREAR